MESTHYISHNAPGTTLTRKVMESSNKNGESPTLKFKLNEREIADFYDKSSWNAPKDSSRCSDLI